MNLFIQPFLAPIMEPVPTARDAHDAAISGEWPTVYEFYFRQQTSPVNESGDRILHILSRHGHSNIIRRLLQLPLLANDCLLAQNNTGNTALHEATRVGSIEIVEIMVETDERVLYTRNFLGNTSLHEATIVGSIEIVEILVETDERVLPTRNDRRETPLFSTRNDRRETPLLSTRNDLGETPLYCAAAFGRKQILHFLYDRLSLYDRNNTNGFLTRDRAGRTILHAAVYAGFYDLALDIVALHSPLTSARCNDGTALNLLAQSPASFRSGTGYTFKNIGSSPFILLQILQVIIYIIIPSCQCRITITDWRDMDMMDIGRAIMSGLRWIIRLCPVVRTVSDAKDMHSNAKRLAENLINVQALLFEQTCIKESFHRAIEFGVVELVEKVLKEFPDAVEWYDRGYGWNILHLVARHGSEQVFNFLKYQNIPIDRMMRERDILMSRDPLGLVADCNFKQLINVHGPYQKTSWLVFWYKSLKDWKFISSSQSMCPAPHADKYAPHDCTSTYKIDADTYVKDMSKAFMPISILIVMINFHACNIVPGGYNQNTGYPMFLGHPDLDGFLLHVSVALFCSFASLAAALSIHFSAFDIEDYYLSLPLKLYVGGTMLFMSVNCTFSAYVHAIRLKTQDSSYPHTGQGLYFVRHYGIVGIQVLTLLSYIEIMYPFFLVVLRVCLLEVGNMQYNLIRSIRTYWHSLITSIRMYFLGE